MSREQFPLIYKFFNNDEYQSNVLINKYLLRDEEGNFLEHSAEEVIDRVCNALSEHTKDKAKYYKLFKEAINGFRGVCPQGSILAAAGNEVFPQSLSNCFVIESPQDSIEGIFKTSEEEAQLMKRRGGVGLDISTLRPYGYIVKNAARTSSGTVGWMDHFSNVCRAVGQGGRRGALMITLSVKHPDAEMFAKSKLDLKYCTGANISLKITDEFMKAVVNDEKFIQQWPVDSSTPKVIKEVNARELWKTIYTSAHSVAEPGLIMWDNAVRTLPANYYEEFKSISTNPCCFSVESEVSVVTVNGVKEIKEVNSEDLVWIDSNKSWERCSGYFKAGVSEVYKVTLSSGEVLEITENHKLEKIEHKGGKDFTSLTELKYLKTGDNISAHVNPVEGYRWSNKGTKEEGLVLGLLSERAVIYFDTENQNIESLWKQISPFLNSDNTVIPDIYLPLYKEEEDVEDVIKKVFKSLNYNLEYGERGPDCSISRNLNCRLLIQKFSEKYKTNIMDFVEGSNSFLYESSEEFVKSYLKSYFTSTGLVKFSLKEGRGEVHLTSPDLERLKQIKNLLIIFGIKSDIKVNSCVDYKECSENLHLLRISGKMNILRFANNIGFISQRETKLLNAAVEDYLKYSECEDRCNFVEITNIELLGPREVGCIQVENYNKFTANGIISGNSEIILSAYDSCRLTTICLTNYVINKFEENSFFDFTRFKEDIRIAMRMMDSIVSAEIKYTQHIIDKIISEGSKDSVEYKLMKRVNSSAEKGRRVGLGTHGLADCLAQLKLRYDSDEAIKKIEEIYSTLCHTSYDESVEMAKDLGPFQVWDWEKEKDCPFFKHFPEELISKMRKYGRRNISILTNAPTGSISTLSGVSSGLEPSFRFCYTRRKKINPNDVQARVDFEDAMGDKWQNYRMFDNNVQRYLEVSKLKIPHNVDNDDKLAKYLPNYFITSDKIDWRKRITIQSTMQKYIDHSISSTINLPEDVDPKIVGDLYMQAWREGLKGITVYRDNCRTGVLVTNKNESKNKERPASITRQEAPERPESLPCDVHIVKVDGEEYVVIVSFMGASVYEVFAGSHNNHLPSKKFSASVIKRGSKKRARYYLEYEEDLNVKELDINLYFENKKYAGITRLISMALRHGTPVAYIIDQLNKSSEYMLGFEKCVARVLKKYAPHEDLAKSHKYCEKCESSEIEVRFEEGCATVICHACGMVNSKCS